MRPSSTASINVATLTFAVVASLLPWPGAARATDPASEALMLCERVETAAPSERIAMLTRGLSLAEQAVAADDENPYAHFAVFCHLGKRLQLEGPNLSQLGSIRRLRKEIDTTLRLAPDYPEALVAKGAFLLKLPRMLGGDPEEGERTLRRALELAPRNPDARLYLAQARDADGDDSAVP
jgi:hypothetical protein